MFNPVRLTAPYTHHVTVSINANLGVNMGSYNTETALFIYVSYFFISYIFTYKESQAISVAIRRIEL
jgi:hypothetical protein